ncbi:MAG: SGNH/GDSL hydrolase family protein [Oscillospiraceae bacterium]|nr:SGNH/GDSL hydrolase family protein [Oscillospiraceae bacterium]
MKAKKILKYAAVVLVYVTVFAVLQQLFVPKYMRELYDGALPAEYYESGMNHSVVFVGDCEVYQTFSPPELFREFGITSYIRGGASQSIWQNYWILRDTLRFAETPPQVVVMPVLEMRRGEPVREEFNRLNIDGMRLSPDKWGMIQSSMLPEESALSYIFPLLRYKDRWSDLSDEDIEFFLTRERVGFNGYLMNCTTDATGFIPPPPRLDDYTLPKKSMEYLDKIRALCEENNITLILTKAPTLTTDWYDQWDEQIEQYAAEHGLHYYNLRRLNGEAADGTSDVGWDKALHTQNRGQTLNVFGAEAVTRWLGRTLRELEAAGELAPLTDHRETQGLAAEWWQMIEEYEAHKVAQLSDIEQFGEIRTITRKSK